MADYQAKFGKVLVFIENHLDDELDIDGLCKIAHMSKYHFHRQCSAYFKMPVLSLVKALRFKRAAYQLAYRTEIKVIDIALQAGFESHEAFSRSFKKHFKQSPSDFRQSPDWTPWQQHYQPLQTLRTKTVNTYSCKNVEIVELSDIDLAVMEHHGSPKHISTTIQKFIGWRKSKQLPPSRSRTFNLIYDDPGVVAEDDYQMDVACEVPYPIEDGDTGVLHKVIPAGKFARLRHIGSDDNLGEAVSFLYYQWLQQSGYELRDFPMFLERVSFFPEVAEHEMITDVYLPLI